jgi:hypothetical protein
VKRKTAIRWLLAAALAFSVAASAGFGKDDKKDKPKPDPIQKIDSGSFGVFVRGQRVVTENFTIEQQNGVSVIKAQLKETNDAGSVQRSELQTTGAGELVRYEWSNDVGGNLTVLPNNEFLIERIASTATAKHAEQPFLMPKTSLILDNNFFTQRELLIWRYLASDCKSEGGNWKCQQGPVEFGALVPQDRSSMRVSIELIGSEKVTLRGSERDLLRLKLNGENFEWALWVDPGDQFKLMRVVIPADNTEVIRD